jgi:hypothetical protein
VGGKRPDNVDFFLDEGRAVVTDISKRKDTPWHSFKTQFYRRALMALTGLKVDSVDMSGRAGETPNIKAE